MVSLIHSAERNAFDSAFTENFLPAEPGEVSHTHSGEIEMKKVINRLSELSDALQTVKLFTEAELVRAHITRLSYIDDEADVQNQDIESVLLEFIREFEAQ